MGLFRSVFASLTCKRCSNPFEAEVQFKTGGDWQEEYREGDRATDLAPGTTYDGTTSRYCDACARVLATDIVRAHRDVLARMAAQGTIDLRDEAGDPIVGPQIDPALAALFGPLLESVRAYSSGHVAATNVKAGLPPRLTIFSKGVQQWPPPPGVGSWEVHQRPFPKRLSSSVEAELVANGWEEGSDGWLNTMVTVDAEHVLRVVPYDEEGEID